MTIYDMLFVTWFHQIVFFYWTCMLCQELNRPFWFRALTDHNHNICVQAMSSFEQMAQALPEAGATKKRKMGTETGSTSSSSTTAAVQQTESTSSSSTTAAVIQTGSTSSSSTTAAAHQTEQHCAVAAEEHPGWRDWGVEENPAWRDWGLAAEEHPGW